MSFTPSLSWLAMSLVLLLNVNLSLGSTPRDESDLDRALRRFKSATFEVYRRTDLGEYHRRLAYGDELKARWQANGGKEWPRQKLIAWYYTAIERTQTGRALPAPPSFSSQDEELPAAVDLSRLPRAIAGATRSAPAPPGSSETNSASVERLSEPLIASLGGHLPLTVQPPDARGSAPQAAELKRQTVPLEVPTFLRITAGISPRVTRSRPWGTSRSQTVDGPPLPQLTGDAPGPHRPHFARRQLVYPVISRAAALPLPGEWSLARAAPSDPRGAWPETHDESPARISLERSALDSQPPAAGRPARSLPISTEPERAQEINLPLLESRILGVNLSWQSLEDNLKNDAHPWSTDELESMANAVEALIAHRRFYALYVSALSADDRQRLPTFESVADLAELFATRLFEARVRFEGDALRSATVEQATRTNRDLDELQRRCDSWTTKL